MEIKVFSVNDEARTDSLTLAEVFGKQHKHVIRDIEALQVSEKFNGSNFGPDEYLDSKGEKRTCYTMTKNGFMMLAMGWRGKDAFAIKEAYIEKFDEMQQAGKQLLAIIEKLQAENASLKRMGIRKVRRSNVGWMLKIPKEVTTKDIFGNITHKTEYDYIPYRDASSEQKRLKKIQHRLTVVDGLNKANMKDANSLEGDRIKALKS